MNTPDVYTITIDQLRKGDNQPVGMTLADLIDELEKLDALPKETAWQMRLALIHRDQEQIMATDP